MSWGASRLDDVGRLHRVGSSLRAVVGARLRRQRRESRRQERERSQSRVLDGGGKFYRAGIRCEGH